MSRIETLPADQRAVLQLLLRRRTAYGELSGLLSVDEAEVRRRAHGALDALGPDETPGLDPERRAEIGDYLLGQQGDAQRAETHRLLEGSPAGRAWARVVAGELRELAGDGLPDIPAEARAEAAPRSSRLGGALLLGGIALVAIAAVLFFVLRGGGNDDEQAAAPAASATATQPQAQVEAQANLIPPSNRKGLKALGVVLVQRAQGRDQIVAAVQGLPKPKSGGYGIWLYAGPGKAKWLGFFAGQDTQGRLLARGALTTPIADYREILVTREAKGNPPRPGPIFLRGPIQTSNASNGGG
jgi:hypothetical protein